MPLFSIVRIILKPDGLTQKEAALGDAVWMLAAALIFLAAMFFYY